MWMEMWARIQQRWGVMFVHCLPETLYMYNNKYALYLSLENQGENYLQKIYYLYRASQRSSVEQTLAAIPCVTSGDKGWEFRGKRLLLHERQLSPCFCCLVTTFLPIFTNPEEQTQPSKPKDGTTTQRATQHSWSHSHVGILQLTEMTEYIKKNSLGCLNAWTWGWQSKGHKTSVSGKERTEQSQPDAAMSRWLKLNE